MSEFQQTESDRYTLQLIRLNQIGIYILLIYMVMIVDIPEYFYVSTLLFSTLLIGLNALAFFHSATGVNPGEWFTRRGRQAREWLR